MWPQGLYNNDMLGENWRNESFYERAEWRLCWVLWPSRCDITNRWLWPGQLAYQGQAMWTGPGEPAIEKRWHDRQEHLIWTLKQGT